MATCKGTWRAAPLVPCTSRPHSSLGAQSSGKGGSNEKSGSDDSHVLTAVYECVRVCLFGGLSLGPASLTKNSDAAASSAMCTVWPLIILSSIAARSSDNSTHYVSERYEQRCGMCGRMSV